MFGLLKKMLVAVGLMSVVVGARAETADQFIKAMSDKVVAAITYNAGIKSGNVNSVSTYVDGNIMPYVDFTSMVSRVVGPAWNQASASEKSELVAESRKYLVRTYAGSLKGANISSIDVYPASGSEVRSRINTGSGKNVMVSYRLINNGGWKVTDISFGGVWLVKSYAGQFQPVVAKGGVKGLIAHLKSKR